MTCFDCENCIDDYQDKPYCLVYQMSLVDHVDIHADRDCHEYEPTKDARMNME